MSGVGAGSGALGSIDDPLPRSPHTSDFMSEMQARTDKNVKNEAAMRLHGVCA